MYLLDTTTKRLSSFFDKWRPPYAILSHTWGTEEVTFEDLKQFHEGSLRQHPFSSLVSSRAGWRKIEACCDQALRDGLKWVWIDTCCIDKSSSAELSEAINSMFAWYRDSKVCYAFLSDVDEACEDISEPTSSFRSSRWFTRGWTLQELLAPRHIIFFSSDWSIIGPLTKGSKLSEVAGEITSIHSAFLEGLDLRKANIAVRMSWASERVTTRKEDMAYCLLGIFDVNMPLLYGESTKAFDRLQEEILKRTYDHSLLAWGLLPWDQGYSPSVTEPCGILATSTADFVGCGNHNVCKDYRTSRDYQMTNKGLRIQLSLQAPPTIRGRRSRCVAILDCFSRQEPTRRIGIPLEGNGDGLFVRTSRSLLLSDIHPHADVPTTGYEYISKTIHVAVTNDVARHQLSNSRTFSSLVQFPPHYHYDVKYVHPLYGIEEDPYTVEPRSLRIRREWDDGRHPGAHGFVEHCSAYWALWCDILTNIISGRQPYSQIRPRPDSIILCVKLTRKNYVKLARDDNALRKAETPSFIAFLAKMPYLYCRLASLPRNSSHIQSAYSSAMLHSLMGHRSLTVANETLVVLDSKIPDNSNNQMTVLFKIDVKTKDYLVPKAPLSQRIWPFVKSIMESLYDWYIIPPLGAYIVVLYLTPIAPDLYLSIWVFIFMPFIYDINSNRIRSVSRYENFIFRVIIVLIASAVSLWPALQPTGTSTS